jgi:hypothetical protein
MSEQDVIERAKAARNGDRFSRLWAGDCSDYDNDHSEPSGADRNLSRGGRRAYNQRSERGRENG